jgi:hypothetical protein
MKTSRQKFIEKFSYETESEYTIEELSEMDDYELFDTYMKWNGIIGYTSDILEVLKQISGKDIIR